MCRDFFLGSPPALVVSLIFLAISAWLLSLPEMDLALLFPDDAFFYLKTAYHVGSGAGITFDGINPTNGFHPLYLILLSIISAAVPLQDGAGIRIVLALATALTIFWFFTADRLARALDYSRGARFSLLALLLPVAFNQDFGTETDLLLPLAWGFVLLAYRFDGTLGAAILSGLLGALLCLTRLDSILVVFAVSAATIAAQHYSGRVALHRSAVIFALFVGPAILALAGFAMLNMIGYGNSSTISSWLKFGWRSVELEVGKPLFPLDPHYLALAAGLFLALISVGRLISFQNKRVIFLGALGAWMIVHSVTMTLFLRGGMEFWYFTLPFSIAALILIDLLYYLVDRQSLYIRKTVIACSLVGGIFVSIVGVEHWLSRTWSTDKALEMSRWIRTNLPKGTRVYLVDQSGIVGYFSDQPIINGDGLVNSWEYQRALRGGELPEYMSKYGVNNIIWNGYGGETEIRIPVPLWTEPNHWIEFSTKPIQVIRFGHYLLIRIDPQSVVVSKSL